MASRNLGTHLLLYCFAIILIIFFAGCSTPTQTGPGATPTVPGPTATSTEVTPSSTPVPAAVVVNGEGIPKAEFEAELARYQAAMTALGKNQTVEEQRQVVLQDLVDQVLLAQGAAEAGFKVDDAMLQARLSQLATQIGGEEALAKWQADHGYQAEEFKAALRRSVAAAWQRDQILDSVPEAAEQVHVRQILVDDRQNAENALQRLVPGLDFATLVYRYDPITGGDLGWFPRDYLADTVVEEAAFALEPEQISEIIESGLGFHILQLIERDPNRPLSPGVRLVLGEKALHDWLLARREQSQIQIVTP